MAGVGTSEEYKAGFDFNVVWHWLSKGRGRA